MTLSLHISLVLKWLIKNNFDNHFSYFFVPKYFSNVRIRTTTYRFSTFYFIDEWTDHFYNTSENISKCPSSLYYMWCLLIACIVWPTEKSKIKRYSIYKNILFGSIVVNWKSLSCDNTRNLKTSPWALGNCDGCFSLFSDISQAKQVMDYLKKNDHRQSLAAALH